SFSRSIPRHSNLCRSNRRGRGSRKQGSPTNNRECSPTRASRTASRSSGSGRRRPTACHCSFARRPKPPRPTAPAATRPRTDVKQKASINPPWVKWAPNGAKREVKVRREGLFSPWEVWNGYRLPILAIVAEIVEETEIVRVGFCDSECDPWTGELLSRRAVRV